MAVSIWSSLVEAWFSGTDDGASSKIAVGLSNQELKLVEFIECLGPALTVQDPQKRAQATKLLSDVLHQIPDNLLSSKEVEHLALFLCERLKDHFFLHPPALYGLVALSRCHQLPEGGAERICQEIFHEVQNQALTQGDRYFVYTILSNFLQGRLKELQKMGGDFVCGFIQVMDEEKDPRNLLQAFRSAQIIIYNFSLGVFVEEMFEVIACYFPIDFTPPPNDPHGIKREDLILELRRCMSACPQFASFCLPLLMEKLTSDVENAKLDSLKTLTAAASVYSIKVMKEFLGSLSSCIQRELFNSKSAEMEKAALDCMAALVAMLAQDISENKSQNAMKEFLEELIQECRVHLCTPDPKRLQQAGRLLHAAASAADHACCLIIQQVVVLLLEQYNKHTQVISQVNILNVLKDFIEATRGFSHSTGSGSTVVIASGCLTRGKLVASQMGQNPLCMHREQLVGLFTALSSSNVSLRHAAIICLSSLLQLEDVLLDAEKTLLVRHFTTMGLLDADPSVRIKSAVALSGLAANSPDVVTDLVLPRLLQELDVDGNELHNLDMLHHALDILTAICCHGSITTKALQYILLLVQNQVKDCSMDVGELRKKMMQCVEKIVVLNMSLCQTYLYTWLVPELFRLCIGHLLVNDCLSSDIIEHMSKILRKIAANLNARNAKELCERTVALFLDGDLQMFDVNLSQDYSFQPLKVDSDVGQTRLVSLLSAVVCSLTREVDVLSLRPLLDQLANLAVRSTDEFTQISAAKCYAGLVNKIRHNNHLEEAVLRVKGELEVVVTNSSSTKLIQSQALHLWSWVSKALAVRGHPQAKEFVRLIFDLLDSTDLGEQAAKGIYVLMNEFEDVLNSSLHAHIRIMYRQRLFVENIQYLTSGFHKANSDTKVHYLTVLCHMLNCLPKQVLVNELAPVIPMLVLSLLTDNTMLQMSTMKTLKTAIEENPELLSQHSNSLVAQLLKLSTQHAHMKVRISALECLKNLTKLPIHLVLPYRHRVIRTLTSVLDDKKRLVRKQAAQTRGEWFLLGAPLN